MSALYWPDSFCLITGPPCSGTSAMASWLGNHPDVAGFSESRFLLTMNAYLKEVERFKKLSRRQGVFLDGVRTQTYEHYCNGAVKMAGKKLIVDKEPLEPIAFPDKGYRKFLSRLRRVFPGSKLIFMLRDPLATTCSMMSRLWGHTLNNSEPERLPVEAHIETWCTNARIVLDYVDDPNSHVCLLNRLIEDPETESERILAFLSLPSQPPFVPRATRILDLDTETRKLVSSRTAPYLEALASKGLRFYETSHTS